MISDEEEDGIPVGRPVQQHPGELTAIVGQDESISYQRSAAQLPGVVPVAPDKQNERE